MKTFNEMNTMDNNLMIVDSLNLAFRYKHKKAVNFKDDYMKTVDSFRKSYKCSKVIIAGDMGSSRYRKAISPEYKQNRKDKYELQTEQEAEEFKEFIAEVNDILETYEKEGVYPSLRFPGVEADDIAAYIVSNRAKYLINNIWLLSSDRDWDLLISDNVSRFSYVTRKEITKDNWNNHYDFDIEDYISIKCIMGDSGDNVIGVPGIGPVKAKNLVKQYGSAYDIADSIPISSKYKYIQALNDFGSDNILKNYALMDLLTFCEEAIGPDNCKIIDNKLGEYLV